MSDKVLSINRHIGKRIHRRRCESMIKRRELDRMVGFSLGTIKSYETGQKCIDNLSLDSIASVLNVDLDYFYEGLPPELYNDSQSL